MKTVVNITMEGKTYSRSYNKRDYQGYLVRREQKAKTYRNKKVYTRKTKYRLSYDW